jgi:hypothetical protein
LPEDSLAEPKQTLLAESLTESLKALLAASPTESPSESSTALLKPLEEKARRWRMGLAFRCSASVLVSLVARIAGARAGPALKPVPPQSF